MLFPFSVSAVSSRLVSGISSCCPNVEDLTLSAPPITEESFDSIFANFKQLKKVKLCETFVQQPIPPIADELNDNVHANINMPTSTCQYQRANITVDDESINNMIANSLHLKALFIDSIDLQRSQALKLMRQSPSLKLITSQNIAMIKSSLTIGECKDFWDEFVMLMEHPIEIV